MKAIVISVFRIIVDVLVLIPSTTSAWIHPIGWTASINAFSCRRFLPNNPPSLNRSQANSIFGFVEWHTTRTTMTSSTTTTTTTFTTIQQSYGTTQLRMIIGSSPPPIDVRDELGCSPTLTVLVGSIQKLLPIQSQPQPPITDNNDGVVDGSLFSRRRREKRKQKRRGSQDDTLLPYFFDPLGLANDYNFPMYREAELKHGRASMIGVACCIYSTYSQEDMVRFITQLQRDGTTILQHWWHQWIDGKVLSSMYTAISGITGEDYPILILNNANSNDNNNNDAITDELLRTSHAIITTLHFPPLPLPSPYLLLQDWTWWGVGRMVLFCGFLETFVLIQVDAQAMPGDYNVGYWGTRDKGRNERSLICELENGRLAMVVMGMYFLSDVYGIILQ
jgi:hypothetical protein